MKQFRLIFLLTLVVYNFLIYTNSYSQLNGNYIIGTGGNYPNIRSAVSDLVNIGVSGAVVFNIKAGSYTEAITIDSVKGTSSGHTVTFKSQTGDAEDVIWYSSSNAGSTFNLRISKADYLTFSNITFSGDSTGNEPRKLIELFDNSAA